DYARHSAVLGSEADARRSSVPARLCPGSACPVASGGARGSVTGRSSRKRLSYCFRTPPCGRLDSSSGRRPARFGEGCPCDALLRETLAVSCCAVQAAERSVLTDHVAGVGSDY